MAHIKAPFTNEQVEVLKKWQSSGMHPFTCGSENSCERLKQTNEGALIPTMDGWICPCGKYTQNWCHDYMVQSE